MKKLKRGRTILGRIKWWDVRDEHGVAYEMNGNEFYIDVSVLPKGMKKLKDGQFIKFKENITPFMACQAGLDVVPVKVTEITKSEFQAASTLRNGIAYLRSVEKQLTRIRKIRLAGVA